MDNYFYELLLLAVTQNRVLDKYTVNTDVTGIVTSSALLSNTDNSLPEPSSVILLSQKYPNVVFYANYYSNTTDSIIYRFSSGIILDSSTETPQYKIVFASYNVKTAKVTFVEKVLS